MPKIRGVKPELWTDEDFVELSPYARLLWIGLWNHACDNGHLQDKSKQIKMRVLPTDEVNCAELLREIEGQGLIHRAAGWITIPNLSHHQKPHKRWWTTCDKPGCELPEGASHAPANRGTTVAPPKGNGVTTADGEGDGEGDGDGELKVNTSRELALAEPAAQNAQTLVAEWIDHCDERPPGRVVGQIAKEVGNMLGEGVSYERVRAGLAEWNTRDLHPSTLPSVVHGLNSRKPRTKRAEDEAMFQRQLERAIARERGQE